MTAEPILPDGKKTVYAVLSIWLIAAIAVGASGIFAEGTPPIVAATVWGLTIAALISWRAIPAVRSFSLEVDLRVLVGLHVTRFVGVWFFVLYRQGRFPFLFGAIGGVWDVLVACGALALLSFAFPPKSGTAILIWNAFGLADIIGAVNTAMREGLRDSQSMLALREFPLSVLPTFLVPLIICTHLLIFYRLRTKRF